MVEQLESNDEISHLVELGQEVLQKLESTLSGKIPDEEIWELHHCYMKTLIRAYKLGH